ncbi:MAG: ParB/RepB/Spo0J family partition protein [Oscillibacter sp.]|nr:ParB/RepB/Spo0J family partition protein [Oscillibacter sp.]
MRNNRKGDFLSARVQYLPVAQIRPNPQQPRSRFDEASMNELADSIRHYGILQPLTVRRTELGYELVAGERRLRAAQMAGLREVPCLTAKVGEEDSGLLALIENLQRRDLDFIEEAQALSRLIARYGLSQEEAAAKIGKSQSAVANKLRLLRLAPDIVALLRENGLSERHARALLRLQSREEQEKALHHIIAHGLNVAQTEEYIEKRLRDIEIQPSKGRTTYIIKDVRLFLNSINRSVDLMRRSGVHADCGRQDTEDEILLTIRIPKRAAAQ